MKKLLLLLICPLSLFATNDQSYCECPYCSNVISIETIVEPKIVSASIPHLKAGIGILGETWICPNSACGYENYIIINYCGLCGTKQP